MRFLRGLWDDESGAVATEYVILVGLVAIALIGTIVAFKDKIAGFFSDTIETGLENSKQEAAEGSNI